MTTKPITLHVLLIQELRSLYNAEIQLIKALPDMVQAATSENLKQAFQNHWAQTKNHAQRLIRAMDCLGESSNGKNCDTMESLIAEGNEFIESGSEDLIEEENIDIVKDAGFICAAQKIEHYEISGYGSAITLAEILGFTEVVQLLQQTLKEERVAVLVLTEIAQSLNHERGAVMQRVNIKS